MKKFLPIVTFVLVVVAAFIYLLPSFHFSFKGNTYVFTNLTSLADKNITGLNINVVRLSPTYKYVIESATKVGDKDWNLIATKDQKTLERRVESFIGRGYDIRLDNKDGAVVFSVFTQSPLGSTSSVLTTNNSDFSVSSQEPTVSTEAEGAQQAASQANLEKLGLQRSDFGDSTVSASQDTQNQGQLKYEIKLPISTLSPEKINLIKSKSANPINVFIGGKDYTGSFVSNANGVPTDLVLTSATSVEEAAAARTYLNTESYFMGYSLTNVESYQTKNPWVKLAGLIIIFFIAAILLNRATLKDLSQKKALYILGYTLIGLAAMKLLGEPITTGVIVLLGTIIIMTIFSMRSIFYIGFGAAIFMIQLFGYLYFLELSWTQSIILLIISALVWSTNYYGSKNQK